MTIPDNTDYATCGLPRRDHVRGWMPGPGWHVYEPPTAEQAEHRYLARFPRQRTNRES
ncbi:hypothetical protein [Kitasatospora sp. NPDC087314]|uniref:hypothetical protein n=1 Tax=Kitasatospora sp. NPDC087314 TaxID=3364068 RepID=UPI0037F2BF2B